MRLKFDARARAILRRMPVVNVYSALAIVLLAALAVQGARLVWTIVTPVSPLGAWVPAAPALPGDPAGVFAAFDPFYRSGGAATPRGPSVTTLSVKLYGTRIDTANGVGSAIIAGPDGVQKSVSVGEEVAPGVTLKSVAFDHVTLDRGGASEDMFLDQSSAGAPAAAAPPPAGGAPAPAQTVAPAPAPDAIKADTSAIPRIDGGRISGLVLRGQGGSAFRAAGLKDGDVLTAIGGRPVGGPADLDRLKAGGVSDVTIERDGKPMPLRLPAGGLR